MSDTKDQRAPRWIVIACFVFAVAGLAISRYWVYLFPHAISLPSPPSTTQPVGVGDEFNALGAIFTLLAFIALMGALLLQRKDLDLQRQDLDLHRDESNQHKIEIAEQRQQLENQQKDAAKEQVRREVFQLMDAWQELVHHTGYKRETDGRLAFSIISENLHSDMERARGGQPLSRVKLREAYDEFFRDKNQAVLGHYFRLLYHILRYINRSKAILSWRERKQLARLIRAHLSEPEFHLLFGTD